MKKYDFKGIFLLILGCVMMSSVGIFANLITDNHPLAIVGSRMIVASLTFPLIALILLPFRKKTIQNFTKEFFHFLRHKPKLFFVSGLSMTAIMLFYTLGTILFSTSLSIIMLYSASIYLPFMEKLLKKFKFRSLIITNYPKSYFVSVVINIGGLLFIVSETFTTSKANNLTFYLGFLSSVCASLSFALLMVSLGIVKKEGYKSEHIMVSSSFMGLLLFSPILFVLPFSFSPGNNISILGLGVISTSLGGLVYLNGFTKVKATIAPILAYIEPVSGFIMAGFFLGEKFTFLITFGIVLILSANLIYTLYDIRKTRLIRIAI